jgi:hypothetical protein
VLALGAPFATSASFEQLAVTPNGPVGVGFASALLNDTAGTYFVSASLFRVQQSGAAPQALLINAEGEGLTLLGFSTLPLPAAFDFASFTVELVLDAGGTSAFARVTSANGTFETVPLPLVGLAGRSGMKLSHILGAGNAEGAGHVASALLTHFEVEQLAPAVLAVDIDVKPGSRRNPINTHSRGITPVAILSSEEFDARSVDPSSISLAGAPVAATPRGRLLCRPCRVNADALPDLLCQVVTARIDAPLGESIVTLSGTTFDGIAIEGEDTVLRLR